MRTWIAPVFLALATLARAQTCPCPPSNFAAYETETIPVTPDTLALCTADGCGTLAVQITHRVLTAGTTDGSTPPATTHYLAVEANHNAGFPEPPAPITLTVMGGASFTVQLTQPRFVFVPADKSLTGPPPPPAPGPSFVCSKLSTTPTFKVSVNELDQFGSNKPMKLDRLAYVCQSADTTAPSSTQWLACFSLNKGGSDLVDPLVEVFVDAEFFGAFDFPGGDVHPIDEFCAPGTKS